MTDADWVAPWHTSECQLRARHFVQPLQREARRREWADIQAEQCMARGQRRRAKEQERRR